MRERSKIVMPESGPACAIADDPSVASRASIAQPRATSQPSLMPEHDGRAVADHCYPRYGIAMFDRDGEVYGKPMKSGSEDGDREADERRSAALIGLIIILALAIAGVILVRELRERSKLEDCLMSGRTNCAPIEVPLRQ